MDSTHKSELILEKKMTFCVGIKANGSKCECRALIGQPRCRTHANAVIRNGPNRNAVSELKYIQRKEIRELKNEWETRSAAETDINKKKDMLRDYNHAQHVKKIQQRHEVELLERAQRDEVARTGVDPDRAAIQRRNEEFLQRVNENQRRREAELALMEQMRVQREINRGELAIFAADNQNVHTTQTVNFTKQIVQRLLKISVPNEYKWNLNECSKTPGDIIMSCKLSLKAAWQMTAKYCQDETIYDLEKGIYGKVLDSVWQYILSSPDKVDLCRCLKQEMEDNIGMCAQGNLSRLCNILSGYMEGIGAQESPAEILGRKLPLLMEVEDETTRLRMAFELFVELSIPADQWLSWAEPLVETGVLSVHVSASGQVVGLALI